MSTSPRVSTPPRSRAAAISAARNPAYDESFFTPVHRETSFWIYLVIAAIVFVFYWFIQNNAQKSGFLDSLRKPANSPNQTLLVIIWAIILLLLVYSTSVGVRSAPTDQHRMLINVAFGLYLALFVIWAVLFYQQKNVNAALWIAVLLLIDTLWLMYLLWNVHRGAAYLQIINIIWLVFVIYHNWQIANLNKVVTV